MVACAVAFMPLLNGQAFAAAKKPKKAKITSFTQNDTMTAEGYTVTGKWKKAKNAKKYKVIIKEDGTAVLTKTVSKKTKSISYAKAQVGKKYTLSVQSLNGKKKAKAATKNLTVVEKRAALKSATISLKAGATDIQVGDVLTAAVDPADATVTYQWYAVSATGLETPISGATGATYSVQAANIGSKLKVVATAAATDTKYTGSVSAITQVAVAKNSEHADIAYGDSAYAVVGTPVNIILNEAGTATTEWYLGDARIAAAANQLSYTPVAGDAGKVLTCVVKIGDKTTDPAITFGTVAKKDIAADYVAKIDGDAVAGETITAKVVNKESSTTEFNATGYTVTYAWYDAATDEVVQAATVANPEKLAITSALAGKDLYVKVVVLPGEKYDYTGELKASTKAGAEVADPAASYIQGVGKVGEEINAVIFGTLGTKMTNTAEITWVLSYTTGGISDFTSVELSSGTNNATYTVNKATFDKVPEDATMAFISAKVTVNGEKKEIGNGFDSVILTKTTIDGVSVVSAASGTNQIVLGDTLKTVATSDGEEVADAVEGTDYTVTYYAVKSSSADDLYNEANAVGATAPKAEVGYWYGAKIELLKDAGAKYFTLAATVDPAAAVQGKNALTVKLSGTYDDEAVSEPYALGTVLEATPSITGTVTYKWYLVSGDAEQQIAGATGSTLDTTGHDDYVGYQIKVVASATDYVDAEATTAQPIQPAAKALSSYVEADVTGASVGGFMSVIVKEDMTFNLNNATVKWETLDGTALTGTTTTDGQANYIGLGKALYGKKIKVTVTAEGYTGEVTATSELIGKYEETAANIIEMTAENETNILPNKTVSLQPVEGVVDDFADIVETVNWYQDSVDAANEIATARGDQKYQLAEDDEGCDIIAVVTLKAPYDGAQNDGGVVGVAYWAEDHWTLEMPIPTTITATYNSAEKAFPVEGNQHFVFTLADDTHTYFVVKDQNGKNYKVRNKAEAKYDPETVGNNIHLMYPPNGAYAGRTDTVRCRNGNYDDGANPDHVNWNVTVDGVDLEDPVAMWFVHNN